jgi:hypothetical protein
VADSVKFKEAGSLKHHANLGEEVSDVDFEAGQEVTVLHEWEKSYLVKDDDGKLFNVPKELVEAVD